MVVAIAIAPALITKSEDKNVKVLDLEKNIWDKKFISLNGFC